MHRHFIHSAANFCLRKPLNSKIDLTLSFPELKALKQAQKFLDPEGNMIKVIPTLTPFPCTLEFSFFLGILFISETC